VRTEGDAVLVQAVEEGALPVSFAAALAKSEAVEQRRVVKEVRAGAKPTEALRQVERWIGKFLAATVKRGGDRKSNRYRDGLIQGAIPEGIDENQSRRW
jgi:hypothetical protein